MSKFDAYLAACLNGARMDGPLAGNELRAALRAVFHGGATACLIELGRGTSRAELVEELDRFAADHQATAAEVEG